MRNSKEDPVSPEVSLKVLSDLPDQSLERQLSDEKFSGLLVPGEGEE